jgi:hypothetical protein
MFFNQSKKPKSLGANLVNIAYSSNRPSTYTHDNQTYTKIYDDDNNVAYKDSNNNIKIGIAGSKNMNDALTDAKLFFGQNIQDTDRYKKSADFLKQVMNNNSNANVELFGHSLSGTIANQLQKDNPNISSTAYNPYLLNTNQISNKTRNIRTYTDPASLLVAGNIENQLEGSSLNPIDSHSINHFKFGGLVFPRMYNAFTEREHAYTLDPTLLDRNI